MAKQEKDIALQVNDLVKKYNHFTAVNGISFEVRKNEIFGLLGPNGAGKTTTISMICGLLPITSGSVTFPGYENNSHKLLIGYCPQENIFYPKLTCLEQLLFIGSMYGIPHKSVKARALELLELLGLKDKANIRAGKLSGGMKRRLNICFALIHDPKLLILDEPEAGLDPQSRILVRDFIKSSCTNKTVIITTHNMDEADRLANRTAIMDHGQLLALDTTENLKKTIGEGDMLEISTDNGSGDIIDNFVRSLSQKSINIKKSGNSLFIKHHDIINQLPDIKITAEKLGLSISEFKLRENTLEDVFIHLTGRSLRQ